MPTYFENLSVGKKYERPYLAKIWGYKGFQAISRGVITPSGTNIIILFVTREKQAALPQYHDYIDGNLLYWEGEKKHSSDSRIIQAHSNGDSVHLFYRDIHHTPFTYYGEISLNKYELHTSEPSKFIFSIGSLRQSQPDLIDEIEDHKYEFQSLDQTEKESVVKSRIGQGIFRDGVINLWSSCAVTGLNNLTLLRASHIKPWRVSTNDERIDPMNGLLLQPTLDHLFDAGLVTFDDKGEMLISPHLSDEDTKKLGLVQNMKLRKINSKILNYMKYHRTHVFEI